MASVHELIAAAEAQKSPFISMMEGAAGGFYNAQQRQPENDLRRLQMQAQIQEIEQKKQETEWQRMMMEAYKKQEAESLSAASPDTGGPVPKQKLKRVIEVDSHGAKMRILEPEKRRLKPHDYFDETAGRSRIGSYDDITGEMIRKPTDAFSGKQTGTPGQRSTPETPIEKSDRATILKLQEAQRQAGARGIPVASELLKQGVEAARRLRLPTYSKNVDVKAPGWGAVFQRAIPGGKTGMTTEEEIGLGEPSTGSVPVYATNPKTGERIMSHDGGNTWHKVK